MGLRRVGFWFRRLFWVSRRHVVVFSARMRKIFPFGVPRGALTVHIAPSKVPLTCKSPGRALQVSGERVSVPFQPAPNGNILRIRARFPTRWARFTIFRKKQDCEGGGWQGCVCQVASRVDRCLHLSKKAGKKRETDYGGLPKGRGSNERRAIAAEGLTPPDSMPYCTRTTE